MIMGIFSKRGKWISFGIIGLLIAGLVSWFTVQSTRRPNLVLIVIDTLRADHLSCYGYDKIRTPNIDALADEGVLFLNATAHVPITLPSLSTIMSSTLPPTNGVHYNEGFYLDNSATTLAEILSGEGYRTLAVVAAVVLDSITGISQGFQRYDDDFSPLFTGYQPFIRAIESQFNQTQRRADEVTDRALALAGEMDNEEPFFLFVHYFDPHFPKDPPPPYSSIVDPTLPIGDHDRQIQLYDGEIAYTDAHIGRLIEGLRTRGLLENTLIALTGDHGEGLDEHDERTHSYFTYNQTLHIPLVMSMPGKIPSGMIYSGLASHVDIAPTVLDILGIDYEEADGFHGISLYPFENGEGSHLTYFECAAPFVMYGWSGLRGVRSARWKYIEAPREELYDLARDPREEANLIDQAPHVADSLREEMNRIIAGVEIFDRSGRLSREEGKGAEVGAFEEKLRALGYVGAAGEFTSNYEEIFDRSLDDPKDKLDDFNRAQQSIISIRWGMALMEKDSVENAVGYLENAVEKDPKNTDAYFYLGLANAQLGKYDEAGRRFEQALENDPDYLKASLALADLHLLRGDPGAARSELEGAASRGIDTRKELVRAARLWGRLGEGDRMVGLFEGILEEEPGDIPVSLYIGEHYLSEGNFERALPYLEPLPPVMNPGDSLEARLYYGLGRCYYHGGELLRAVEMYRKVVSLDSTAADGYSQLGIVYDDLGEYELAVENYQKALELDPGMVEMHSNLGVSYYKMGRYDESRASFEAYLPHVTDADESQRVKEFIEYLKEL
jgi:arylsulfatase A-like enzyme/Flp pilus assembly protein TadD